MDDRKPANAASILRAYSYAWITLAFFLLTIAGHWIFGWFAYLDEQKALGQLSELSGTWLK